MTHICVSENFITGSDDGLSPGRCQAIIWTNAGMLLIEPLGINFNEILIGINTFSFKKMHLKMSSAKWRLFRLGLNMEVWKYGRRSHILVEMIPSLDCNKYYQLEYRECCLAFWAVLLYLYYCWITYNQRSHQMLARFLYQENYYNYPL